MSAKTNLILFTVFCAFVVLAHAQEKCGECMADNEASCVDKTSYYLCMNGKPLQSSLFTCPKDHVCTNSAKICEPESGTIKAVCDSSCSKCPTDGGKYTCVTKTQFGRCIDNKVTIVNSCESGSICSTEMLSKAGQICAPKCVVDFFGLSSTCSNDEQISTTVVPPTTPNLANLEQKCKDDPQHGENKKIYYVINDVDCKTYIYCEKFGVGVEALLMKCSNGFYDVNLKKCVKEQPEGCGVTNTPIVPTSTPSLETSTTNIDSSSTAAPTSSPSLETSTTNIDSSSTVVPTSSPSLGSSTTNIDSSSTTALPSSTASLESSTTNIDSSSTAVPTSTTSLENSTTNIESSSTAAPTSTPSVSSSAATTSAPNLETSSQPATSSATTEPSA